MKETKIKGKVTFINHEKKYAIIEYDDQKGKKKTATGNIDVQAQKKLKEQNLIKKTHLFLMGDVVSFKLKLSDRGDRMVAHNIEFLYNDALDVLINKSKTNNKFTGYLKEVDDRFFVKEIESYLFFPVPFSPWQIKPTEEELNEAVAFSLENTDKKDKITASLFTNNYISEFSIAVKHFKSKAPLEAEVYNVTAHGIYVNVIGDKIQAKLPVEKDNAGNLPVPGDKVIVMITYLSKSKIVVEEVRSAN
jgi:hypothetical protein